MSIATSTESNVTFSVSHRRHYWLGAAMAPLALAPFWLSCPQPWTGPLGSFSGLLLLLLIACSSVTDLSQRKIFNWTTYTAFAWAIALNVLPYPFSNGAIGLSASVSGAVVCFVLMLIPYTLARGGAGDVKLAAAIGALVGLGDGLLVIAFAYIIAAVTILGWTIWKQGPLNLITAMLRRFGARWLPCYVSAPTKQQNLLLEQPVPLAGFFAVAVLLVVFDVPQLLKAI